MVQFIDMRCKHSRVLSIIRERLHREPIIGIPEFGISLE